MEALATLGLDYLKGMLNNSIKTELRLLKEEIDDMQIFLEETSERRNNDHLFRRWETQIRKMIFEVEDTIDTYLTETAESRIFKKRRLTDSDTEKQVKSLRQNKVKPLFEEAKKELLNTPVDDASKIYQAESMGWRKEDTRPDNVVGFEVETMSLIEYLRKDSDKLEVVSIIGMPGLGKTTVAWKIYNDPDIKNEFPTLIWLHVSKAFNKKNVLLTIMKKFTKNNLSRKSVQVLSRRVKNHLERDKFLIFMDDVWSQDAWNEIKEVLTMTNTKGKILMTSRDEKVALNAKTTKEPHKLRFLTREESWELLKLEMSSKLDAINESLEQVGKIIAENCGGLPLSIRVIGGILNGILARPGGPSTWLKEWERVSESVLTTLINDDREKRVENIISLSYTSLPYGLRDCFLYLGMFPEDREIPAWKLTRLWIAEGFIQIRKRPEKSFEEVALDNLKDLIGRNLLLVGKSKPDGEVKTFRVHDTIREFCKNEAEYEKQNLFQEIRMSKQGVFHPPVDDIEKYRRLCIHSRVLTFLKKKPKAPKARSFLSFPRGKSINLPNENILTITDDFSLLRVFDANTFEFPEYPVKISQLLHLKYLTLTSGDLRVLPDAITKLLNLQTLIIDTSSRTLKIKADIWQMKQLRHLKTKASIVLLIEDGKGTGGENLQTLGKLSPQSCTEGVCTKARNLNALAIHGDLTVLIDSKCLENLSRLEKLKLMYDPPEDASECPLRALPQPHRFPPKLKTLVLSGTYLEWSQMDSVGQLRNLEMLILKDNAFKGKYWDSSRGGFLKLGHFYIEKTDLRWWTASDGAFPQLKRLMVKDCKKLEGVPFELKEKLEVLSVEQVTQYVVSSAKKIEEAIQQMSRQQRANSGGFQLFIAQVETTNV